MDIIVQECRSGRRGSQKKLYMAFFGYAMSICSRYASNEEDAVEIVNDGFLKIFKGLDKFIPKNNNLDADFRAWIKQVMVFTAIDHYRKQQRQEQTENIEPALLHESVSEENQLDKISYKEIVGYVHRLSPAYRAVFSLFAIDGYSHEEISSIMGISIGTSKSNLSKARINLYKMLEQSNQQSNYERKVV